MDEQDKKRADEAIDWIRKFRDGMELEFKDPTSTSDWVEVSCLDGLFGLILNEFEIREKPQPKVYVSYMAQYEANKKVFLAGNSYYAEHAAIVCTPENYNDATKTGKIFRLTTTVLGDETSVEVEEVK